MNSMNDDALHSALSKDNSMLEDLVHVPNTKAAYKKLNGEVKVTLLYSMYNNSVGLGTWS